MSPDDIRTLCGYNEWANRRFIECARTLSPSDFTRDLKSSFGSVRGTFVHLMHAEWRWVRYWKTEDRSGEMTQEEFPTLESIEAAWAPIAKELREFVDGLTNEKLALIRKPRTVELTFSQMLQHLFNHATFHRGQLSTMLRQLDAIPPRSDFHVFLSEFTRTSSPS
jgi:uncharacterized damage-inducible protein DinB